MSNDFNPHALPPKMVKGSMISDGQGNFRRVSRQEANHNQFVWLFCVSIMAVVLTAMASWNLLVYLFVWPFEVVAGKGETPLTVKLCGHPVRAFRDMYAEL